MATNDKIAKNVPLSAGDANKEEEEVNLESLAARTRSTKTCWTEAKAAHGRTERVHTLRYGCTVVLLAVHNSPRYSKRATY